MPTLRCLDEGCGHEWFVRSSLGEGADCEECGGPSRVLGVDDDMPAELTTVKAKLATDPARPAHARQRARKLLLEHRVTSPPVPVRAIARRCGFTVTARSGMGVLRARMIDNVIEVSDQESDGAQSFSIAHELGHHFLDSRHGDGPQAEKEADAFAGELLVPGHMLTAAVAHTTDLAALARLFRASRSAVEVSASIHRLGDELTRG